MKNNLLIISNMAHYQDERGKIFGWGPTVEEIDYLSGLFSEVCHVGFLYPGPPPATSLTYQFSNIHFLGLSPAGGESIPHKIKLILKIPDYTRLLTPQILKADFIHIRCPASTSLIALMLLFLMPRKNKAIWVKYAGNWNGGKKDAWTYRFQRWILRRNFFCGVVTVNGEWPQLPGHIKSFLNPCIKLNDLAVSKKISANKKMTSPVQILFAGAMIKPKGVEETLRMVQALKLRGISFTLDLVGEGRDLELFKKQALGFGLTSHANFYGGVSHSAMKNFYEKAHLLCLPSHTEGWPKVIGEGMAYGVVPLSTPVGSIGQYLTKFQVGRVIPVGDVQGFVEAVENYVKNHQLWKEESLRALERAHLFTYERYLEEVKGILGL